MPNWATNTATDQVAKLSAGMTLCTLRQDEKKGKTHSLAAQRLLLEALAKFDRSPAAIAARNGAVWVDDPSDASASTAGQHTALSSNLFNTSSTCCLSCRAL